MLFRDYDLEEKLKELRDVFFFYRADLMDAFLEELAFKNRAVVGSTTMTGSSSRSAFHFGIGGIPALNSSLREALRRIKR